MNGVAVLLCVAALGVEHNWRTTPDGQLEYVLQVEPTFLPSLDQGEAVTSKLPPTAKNVHRFCLRVGTGDLRKVPQRSPELTPLASVEERTARPGADIPVALIVDAQGQSAETTEVSHGWQAVSREQVEYVVQLSPRLLTSLREGDEIYMNIYPEAGSIQQFTIVAGQNVLPRKAARPRAAPAAKDHNLVAAAAAENPAVYGAGGGETSTAGDDRTAEPSRLRTSPRGFKVSDESAEQPGAPEGLYAPAAGEQPGEPAPQLFTAAGAESTYEPSGRTAPVRPAPADPVFDKSQFGQFSAVPKATTRTTGQAAISPPPDGNQYSPPDEESDLPPTNSRFAKSRGSEIAQATGEGEEGAAAENLKVASLDSKNRSGITTASTRGGKTSTTSTAAKDEPKPWWPLFFTCCALFLSVGGNLYLGWTAAEFYSRYRLAVERMRGSDRDSSDD